jgi:hypothetical protein
MKIPIFYEGSVRPIGTFNTDTLTFTRRLHSSRHFLRVPPAICFQDEVISQIKSLNCQRIRVIDLDCKDTYEIDFQTFWEKSFPINRGAGLQVALPLSSWISDYDHDHRKVVKPAKTIREPERVTPGQLALFR